VLPLHAAGPYKLKKEKVNDEDAVANGSIQHADRLSMSRNFVNVAELNSEKNLLFQVWV
jgi:hypothetical protein